MTVGSSTASIDVRIDNDPQSADGSSCIANGVSKSASKVADALKKELVKLDVESVMKFKPSIWKVPDDMRHKTLKTEGIYDPKLISIGPFHRGKQNLQYMEKIKLLYLRDLIGRDVESNQVECYADAILRCEMDARREYSDEFKDMSAEKFVKMLLMDGCFIVEFLLKRAAGKVGKPLTGQLRNMPALKHDLLLLENQIPFFILQTIIDNSKYEFPGSDGITLLDLALHYLHKGKITKYRLQLQYHDGKKIYHLLHLSYLCRVTDLLLDIPNTEEPSPDTRMAYIAKNMKDVFFASSHGLVLHPLKILRTYLSTFVIFLLYIFVSFFEILIVWRVPNWYASSRNKSFKKPRMIPTARELKEAGVHFKNKVNGKNFIDASFKDGKMKIPVVHVQENSNADYRNLLAFEQCCPEVGNNFTSFVVLMDNLVDTVADIAVLKHDGILESKLGCDEEVANFFNGLRSGLCFDFDRHYLVSMFENLNIYCNKEHNRWRAKLMHEYFGNPWAIFSLIGALILLGLTAVQTAYAVKQSDCSCPSTSSSS